jgi:predicted kinase
MTMTITLTAIDLETILACLHNRARTIGDATARDRQEQARLYRLAAQLDLQSTTLVQPASTEEQSV